MNNRKITCYASVVSEIHQSDIYLTVKARLLETPRANLNGVRVTAAFVDEIVDNQAKYVGLPLCADVKNLANGDYTHLGHLYDARTGEFHSAQIGSFYQFEKEETADGAALIGYARIMKRNKAVCKAISELFAEGSLKFSFEISCGSYEELEDGTLQIDASENNYLEGAAVVSFPACENAVALDLVAECNLIADDTRKGENEMNQEITEAIASENPVTEPEKVEVAEEHTDVQETTVETAAAADEVVSDSEAPQSEAIAESTETEETNDANAECDEEKKETAEVENASVIVEERHVEVNNVSVYDTDDGSEVSQHVTHETIVRREIPAEDQSAQVQTAASDEEEDKEDREDEKETPDMEEDSEEKKEEVAEATQQPDLMSLIAELQKTIEELRHEISEIKEAPAHLTAETLVVNAAQIANPFVGDTPMEKKYGLLEKDEVTHSYSLLDKA